MNSRLRNEKTVKSRRIMGGSLTLMRGRKLNICKLKIKLHSIPPPKVEKNNRAVRTTTDPNSV